ncbi:hypothetical protein BDZ91DRAFT_801362 [Kalaharituber pfeilii]|nr:hypothetical protein BDZ91DRAFT_801362 [Kalaharituber pfeilii]
MQQLGQKPTRRPQRGARRAESISQSSIPQSERETSPNYQDIDETDLPEAPHKRGTKRPVSREAPPSSQKVFITYTENNGEDGDAVTVRTQTETRNTVQTLVNEAWAEGDEKAGKTAEPTRESTRYLKSIHSRTRSHLVSACASSIMEVYGLEGETIEDRRTKVAELLDKDRFLCPEQYRPKTKIPKRYFNALELVTIIWQYYFSGPRMKGKRDPIFLDKINGKFLCLVASTMRHCLTFWATGELTPKESRTDFNYANCANMHRRIWRTWKKYKPEVKGALLIAIKKRHQSAHRGRIWQT